MVITEYITCEEKASEPYPKMWHVDSKSIKVTHPLYATHYF